jgi:hypothetical protein
MFTVHPTLLIGPSDWQPQHAGYADYARRIDELWRATRARGVPNAVVFGSPAHHAELAYFTNFVPKLEPAVALLRRIGEPRLFVAGGLNMLDAARPLTFVADLAPLNALGAALKQTGASPALPIGGGAMPTALHRTITDALGGAVQDATAQVWALMQRKSRSEIEAIRTACAILDQAMADAAKAHHAGAHVTTAVLAGERAANQAGAQDVRTLFSLDGGRTLRPFEGLVEKAIEPLQLYIAVRHANYWAEGFAFLSSQPSATADKATALLHSALTTIKAGTPANDLAATIAVAIAPLRIHPAAASIINPIGLALEEPPHTDMPQMLSAGEVYSLKIGLTDGADDNAIVSAMLVVHEDGNEVLWRSGGA